MSGRWKQPHVSPKVETLDVNIRYAISYSPQPLHCENDKMLLGTIKQMYNIIRKLNYCKLEVVIESSPTGRLHYHGWIQITQIAPFILFDIPIMVKEGTYEIDTCNDKWKEYVYKQKDIWEPYIKKQQFPLCYTYKLVSQHIEVSTERPLEKKKRKESGILKSDPLDL